MRFKKGDTVCLNRVKGMPNKSFKIMTTTEILNRQKEAKIIKTVIKQDFDEATQRDLDRYLLPRKRRSTKTFKR